MPELADIPVTLDRNKTVTLKYVKAPTAFTVTALVIDDSTGLPFTKGRVFLDNTYSEPCGDDGKARFYNTPIGTYIAWVSQTGYTSDHLTITVDKDLEITLRIYKT